MDKTLYKHVGFDAVDSTYWPSADVKDTEGDDLYYFTGDVNDGDATGASADWVVATAAAPDAAPEAVTAPEVIPEVGTEEVSSKGNSPAVEGVKAGGLAYTELEDGYRHYADQKPVETVDDPTPQPEVAAEGQDAPVAPTAS